MPSESKTESIYEKIKKEKMENVMQEKRNNQDILTRKDIIIGLAISFWIMVNIAGFAAFGAEKLVNVMANNAINTPGYLLIFTLLIIILLISAIPFSLLIVISWLDFWFVSRKKKSCISSKTQPLKDDIRYRAMDGGMYIIF